MRLALSVTTPPIRRLPVDGRATRFARCAPRRAASRRLRSRLVGIGSVVVVVVLALCLVFGFGGAGMVARADAASGLDDLPWRVSAADWRVLAWPEIAGQEWLRVDVPVALQTSKSLAVADADGQALPYRAVRVGDRLQAVEVALPPALRTPPGDAAWQPAAMSATARFAVHLYLAATVPTDSTSPLVALADPVADPAALPARAPIAFAQHMEKVKARPSTSAEFAIYQWKAPLLEREEMLAALPAEAKPPFLVEPQPADAAVVEGETERDRQRRRRRSQRKDEFEALRYHYETMFVVPVTTDWTFSVVRQDTGPWFIYIDGRSVADWGTAAGDATTLESGKITLTPGLYRFDYFGMSDYDQSFPVLKARQMPQPDGRPAQFLPLPVEQLVTTAGAGALVVQGRDQVLAVGYRLVPADACAFGGTDTVLQVAKFTDLGRNLFGRPVATRSLTINDQPVMDLAATATLALPVLPTPRLALTLVDAHGFQETLAVDLRFDWTRARLMDVTFGLTELPGFEPRDADLAVGYFARLPAELPASLRADARLRAIARDADGAVLTDVSSPIPDADFAKRLAAPWGGRRVATVDLDLEINGHPLSPTRRIRVVEADAPDQRFASAANRLSQGGDLVMLRRPRGEAHPVAPDGPPVKRVLLVDALIARTRHLTDPLDVPAWLASRSNAALTVTQLPVGALGTRADHVAGFDKFLALDDALASDADAVVWAVGEEELAAGFDLIDYRDHLAYLVEATLARHKLPILVTVPVHGDFDATTLRSYALAVRELGVRYHVPVVDYYSASLLSQSLDPYYRLDDTGDIRSATPNAAGAAWYLGYLLNTLTATNAKRQANR